MFEEGPSAKRGLNFNVLFSTPLFFFTSQHQPQKGQSFAISDKCHNKNYSLDNNSDNSKFARGSLGLVHHNLTYKKLNLMILEVKFSNLNSVIL